MSLATGAVGVAWMAANLPGYARYAAALSDPAKAQRSALRRILRANADTSFGRAHAFRDIRTVAEFQARVPLSRYADYRPFIDRIRAGEPGVLTRSRVKVLEPSSGSTSAAKWIPCTRDLQAEFRRAIAPWIVDLYGRRPRLAPGPAYWSITPVAQEERGPASVVRVGFEEDSEYLGGFSRRIVDATLAVPPAVRHIRDIEVFRYATLLFLLRSAGLRLISVWHPSFLSLLLGALEVHWPRLLHDLKAGTLDPPAPLPDPLRSRLASRLRPEPRRAAALKSAAPGDYVRIWPRLALISCWGDAHAAQSLTQLRRAFPGVEIQPKGLLATEAFVTLPFAGRTPLAIRSHFFEFLEDDAPVLAERLEPGRTYSVVVTTGGGLYRYRLEDRVEVTGFVGRTPSLRFLGKEDHVSDLRGEKLHECFVADVMRRVLEEARVDSRFALLAPDDDGPRPVYTLYIECDADPPEALASHLEERLEANPHYRSCVSLGQLAPVRMFRIAGGGFRAYVERCRESGQRLGQIKPLSLSARTGWSESFAGRYVEGGASVRAPGGRPC